MLYALNAIENFTVNATDGYIGKIKDFYFDDRTWKLRYLIVETGIWLKNQKVILPASAIKWVHMDENNLTLDLSMYQVKNGPVIDNQLSLMPQTEIDYLSYYGYSFYRGASESYSFEHDQDSEAKLADIFATVDAVRRTFGDRHLRSCKEMINYDVEASDNDVGYLQGMLFNEDDWSISHLMVNTSNWWLGHQVLLEPECVKDTSWGDAKIYINLLRHQVQDAPVFDQETLDAFNHPNGDHLHQRNKNIYEKKPLFKLV
jgi:uncharacterized protein YrrD